MKHAFALLILTAVAIVFQLVLAPLLPPVLRPDAGLLLGVAVLTLSAPDFGFVALFVLGLQADVLLSARAGALTLSYLLGGMAVRIVIGREFERGEPILAWLSVAAATAIAHLIYCGLAWMFGVQIVWGEALALVASLTLASLVWGFPAIWGVSELLYKLQALAPELQGRRSNERRLTERQKRRVRS